MSALLLSPAETRVLGVLVEKQHTVPDTYPLTLNALVAGCNQKTSRDPVIDASRSRGAGGDRPAEALSLVIESSGGRVMRYAHNAGKVLGVPAAVGCAARGALPARAADRRASCASTASACTGSATSSSVEAFLEELATRPEEQGGALVQRLHRRVGEREHRWAQLLTGPVNDVPAPEAAAPAAEGGVAQELAALRERVATLESQVAALRDALLSLRG